MLARHKRGAAYGTICSGGRLEALIQARERLCRRCQPVYRCEARSAAGRWTATRAPPAPRSSPQPTPWTVSGPTTLCSPTRTPLAFACLQTKCYDSCIFHWSVNPISEYLLDRFIIDEGEFQFLLALCYLSFMPKKYTNTAA